MNTFKALGALLNYPGPELIEALDEIDACLQEEGLLDSENLKAVSGLISHLKTGELLSRQEDYVSTFDRMRSLSLNLYEHLHGDSRDRGQAMVDLQSVYNRHGYAMSQPELPDFLPLLCEFLSLIPESGARGILGDAATIIEALRLGLEKRQSPYVVVMASLGELAGKKINRQELEEILNAQTEDEDSLEAMDAAWEETPVTFGPDSARQEACGSSCASSRT